MTDIMNEMSSIKSALTIHVPSVSPATTDTSLGEGQAHHVISRSPTLKSESTLLQESKQHSGVSNNDVMNRPDILSENSDCVLMTENEINEWDARINEVVDRLNSQHEHFKERGEKLTKRRHAANVKLRNLRQFREKRYELYECVENYIYGVNALLESKTDAENK